MTTGSALVSIHFYLELDGITEALFQECSGLESESEVIEHKETTKGGKMILVKVPGDIKWPNIVLKRGVSSDMNLWNWRKQIEDGQVEKARKNGSIVLYDQSGAEVARYNFEFGWPSKISGPSVNASSNEVAVEEITITHEGLKRVK